MPAGLTSRCHVAQLILSHDNNQCKPNAFWALRQYICRSSWCSQIANVTCCNCNPVIDPPYKVKELIQIVNNAACCVPKIAAACGCCVTGRPPWRHCRVCWRRLTARTTLRQSASLCLLRRTSMCKLQPLHLLRYASCPDNTYSGLVIMIPSALLLHTSICTCSGMPCIGLMSTPCCPFQSTGLLLHTSTVKLQLLHLFRYLCLIFVCLVAVLLVDVLLTANFSPAARWRLPVLVAAAPSTLFANFLCLKHLYPVFGDGGWAQMHIRAASMICCPNKLCRCRLFWLSLSTTNMSCQILSDTMCCCMQLHTYISH